MCSNVFAHCSNVFKSVQICLKIVQICWIVFKTCSNVFEHCSNVCKWCSQNVTVRVMEELLLGSTFYCCQIGGKSRTADSDQMAPFYTRQTWTRNIFGTLPINILGFTHDIPEASLRGQWLGVENMRTTFTLDDVHHIQDFSLLQLSNPRMLGQH